MGMWYGAVSRILFLSDEGDWVAIFDLLLCVVMNILHEHEHEFVA